MVYTVYNYIHRLGFDVKHVLHFLCFRMSKEREVKSGRLHVAAEANSNTARWREVIQENRKMIIDKVDWTNDILMKTIENSRMLGNNDFKLVEVCAHCAVHVIRFELDILWANTMFTTFNFICL